MSDNAAIPGDWATVVEIANRPLSGSEFDSTVIWCQALVSTRSAALEEAELEMPLIVRVRQLEACIQEMQRAIPGGSFLDPQEIADALRDIAERNGVRIDDGSTPIEGNAE